MRTAVSCFHLASSPFWTCVFLPGHSQDLSQRVHAPGLLLTSVCLVSGLSSTVSEWEGSCGGGCQEGSSFAGRLCCHVGPAQTSSSAGGIIKKYFHVMHKPALELTGPFCGLLKFFKDGALQYWLYVMYIHYLHL